MTGESNWKYFPARRLPEVEIAGTNFFLDLRLWEMREVENFANKIDLDDLHDNGFAFEFAFDTRTKNLFVEENIPEDAHIRYIKLPPLSKLDPIGWNALHEKRTKQSLEQLLKKKKVKVFKGKRLKQW